MVRCSSSSGVPNLLIAIYRSIVKVVGVDRMEREKERERERRDFWRDFSLPFETCESSRDTKTSRVLFWFESAEQSRCSFLWNFGMAAFVSEVWSVILILTIIILDQILFSFLESSGDERHRHQSHSHCCTSAPPLSVFASLSKITEDVGLSAQPADLPTLGAGFQSFQKLLEKYLVIHLHHVSTLFECFAQKLALIEAQVGTSCKHLGTLCIAVD